MVMDVIDGKSLAQEEREKKTIGVDRTIKIIAQVCDALEHAHRNGIVHRDLKPGNIMLTNFQGEQDYVKLVDFGIAKLLVKEEDQELTQKGEVFGSPLYMSPEQCLGKDLDGRSDIYSLGTVMYEALTGFVPHLGRNAIETIDMQIHKDPMTFASKRPDIYIPERLESVVLKALAKDPAVRQQSMKELALELEAAVPRKNEALNLRAKIEPSKSSSSRKPVHIGIIIGGLVILSVIAGLDFKHNMDRQPLNTVPPTLTPVTPVSTQTSAPSTTTTTPTSAATPPSGSTITPPSGSVTTAPSASSTSPASGSATTPPTTQVNSGQRPRHKSEQPKPTAAKPAPAKVAKTKKDPWARIENRMKKTAPKSDRSKKSANSKQSSRWAHMEHLLPLTP
jgi:serine/threonine-protein kinase